MIYKINVNAHISKWLLSDGCEKRKTETKRKQINLLSPILCNRSVFTFAFQRSGIDVLIRVGSSPFRLPADLAWSHKSNEKKKHFSPVRKTTKHNELMMKIDFSSRPHASSYPEAISLSVLNKYFSLHLPHITSIWGRLAAKEKAEEKTHFERSKWEVLKMLHVQVKACPSPPANQQREGKIYYFYGSDTRRLCFLSITIWLNNWK